MRLVSCTLAAAILSASPLNSLIAQAAYPASPILIGEVAWAGSSLSDADEWIELWNLSDATVDIGGWSLRGAGESSKTIYLPPGSTIPAYGSFLLSNYDSTYAKSALDTTSQTVTTTVSLSNSTLKIELYDNLGLLVDVAGTGSAPLAGASQPIKTSMLRQDPMLDGALVSSWKSSTERQNLKPSTADLATPGFCDVCAALIPEPETPDIIEPDTASTSSDMVATSTDESMASAEDDPDLIGQEVTTSTGLVSTSTAGTVAPETDAMTASDATTTAQQASSTPETVIVPTQASDSEVQISASSIPPSTSSPQSPTPPPKPNYAMLRLNEIMSYPASGKEWVEIVTLDAANKISLSGCELHDAQGRIMTFGSRTIDPTSNRYLKVELSTARLNNSGDSISLYSPNGQLLDTVSFPVLKKGQTWIRYPDMSGGWEKTDISSPSASNIQSQTTASSTAQITDAAVATNSPQISTETETPNPGLAITTTSTAEGTNDQDWISGLKGEDDSGQSMSDLIASLSTDNEALQTAEPVSKAVKTTAKKTTVKKTKTSTAKVEPIIPFTFAMLNQIEDSPLRVRLAGAVGSTPGLLPNHSFVLQSPEGRGLLIKVPTSRRLPGFGNEISVVGKLYVDDKGVPYVKMAAKDPLETQGSSTTAVPRLVDLTAPSIEDAWAFMSVTGTVKSVKGRTVLLDLGDAELSVTIRQSVKYRPQRLLIGDVVRVSGLLDTTREPAILLPRSADDIVLVEHAKTISAAAAKSPTGMDVPGWTPIGAAAGAVAVTEGAKQLHRRRKQKLLENKLKQLITTEML